MRDQTTFGPVSLASSHDNRLSSRQRLADRFKRFSPDDYVMTHRQLAKPLQVRRQPPRQLAGLAYPALLVHRNDQ
jgi:hypothetical protein